MKYRKKPVVIDAIELTYENRFDVAEWCRGKVAGAGVVIQTLEGQMFATTGDWVIRGVQGEFYPCKPDIFAATYEAVES